MQTVRLPIAATMRPAIPRRIDPPGPKGIPLLGVALRFRRNPLEFLTKLVAEYGDVVRVPMMRIPLSPIEPRNQCYVVNHPLLVRQICGANRRKYRTHHQLVHKLKATLELGQGELLTSTGAQWTERKALLQPSFTRMHVASFDAKVNSCVRSLVSRWQQLPDGVIVDVDRDITRLVTHLFASLFLSLDLDAADAELSHVWERTLTGLGRRMAAPLAVLHKFPSQRNREFAAALAQVEQRLYQCIQTRRCGASQSHDFLALWMQASQAEDGAGLSDKSLRDQLLLMLLAGRRNVANALSWSCHLLGQHPKVAQTLFDEVSAKLGDALTTADKLEPLRYSRMVQREVLRLYPTAWLIARQCLEDDIVGGYSIPRGVTVFMSPYTLHRHPSYWNDAEVFDPERFAAGQTIAPESYLPFGKGPRTCIGNFLTEHIMQVVLVAVSRHFILEPLPGHAARIKATSSLHPDGGLPMILKRRTQEVTS